MKLLIISLGIQNFSLVWYGFNVVLNVVCLEWVESSFSLSDQLEAVLN